MRRPVVRHVPALNRVVAALFSLLPAPNIQVPWPLSADKSFYDPASRLAIFPATAEAQVIGIVGGTGPEGIGLALRLAQAGERIIIGSRSEARGRAAADKIRHACPRPMSVAPRTRRLPARPT